MNSISSNLQFRFGWETNWNWSRNLVIDTGEGVLKRIKRESIIYRSSRRERKGNSRAREKMGEEKKKKGSCSIGSVMLFFYVWIKSIQMAFSQKKSIQMRDGLLHKKPIDTTVGAMDLLPKELIEEEILMRLSVKTLIKLECVSKYWNKFISDASFRRRYRSLQQGNINTPIGFICGDKNYKTDDYAAAHGFCVANKFLYTSQIYVEKEEVVESIKYLNTFGYVIAASKGLVLFKNRLGGLSVYDLVSKKNVNLLKNNLEAVNDDVSFGFKCEERSDSTNYHHRPRLCYKVVCVNNSFKSWSSHNAEIYSSETGTWKKTLMKSKFPCLMHPHSVAKVIGGVFHWHHSYSKWIIAYDPDRPNGPVAVIEPPLPNTTERYGKTMRQLEGTKDGSLQFISTKDMVLDVWIIRKNYMDEYLIRENKWSLTSSISLWDIGVGGIRDLQKKSSRIICADPVDPHIIYLEIECQLYAYNYRQGKILFKFSQKIKVETDVFVHYEWPTWPCL